jgi:flavorubredoxin
MHPFKDFVLAALKKIEDLPVDVIAPGHGPVLRAEPKRYVDYYREWATAPGRETGRPLVALFYYSGYGNTALMAEQIARGLDAGGVETSLRDLGKTGDEEAFALLARADGVIIGSPTIMADAARPVWDLLGLASRVGLTGKPAAAFGSYGWSGEAVSRLEDRLASLGARIIQPGVRVNFAPDADDFAACRDFGRKFADALKACVRTAA